jgi:hypothetical protein
MQGWICGLNILSLPQFTFNASIHNLLLQIVALSTISAPLFARNAPRASAPTSLRHSDACERRSSPDLRRQVRALSAFAEIRVRTEWTSERHGWLKAASRVVVLPKLLEESFVARLEMIIVPTERTDTVAAFFAKKNFDADAPIIVYKLYHSAFSVTKRCCNLTAANHNHDA